MEPVKASSCAFSDPWVRPFMKWAEQDDLAECRSINVINIHMGDVCCPSAQGAF